MHLQSSPLPLDVDFAFHNWLNQPEYDTLIRLLVDGAFMLRVEASKLRVDPFSVGANEQAPTLDKTASEIDSFIAMLEAMKQRKETFEVHTATP